MAAHKRYRNSDARAHIKVQMRSAEIPAYFIRHSLDMEKVYKIL
jgi:hypothetical protein